MYQNPYNQPYYQPQRFQPTEPLVQPMNTQTYIPPVQQMNNQPTLQGKLVDGLDTVKSIEYPLDGSTSYYPFTDGSCIVTKKLQADGTTKTTIYKVSEEDQKDLPKYVTTDELDIVVKELDMSSAFEKLQDKFDDLKDEFKELKKSKKKDD